MKQSKLNIPSGVIGKVPKTKVSKQIAVSEYLKFLEQSRGKKDFKFTPVTKSFDESFKDVIEK